MNSKNKVLPWNVCLHCFSLPCVNFPVFFLENQSIWLPVYTIFNTSCDKYKYINKPVTPGYIKLLNGTTQHDIMTFSCQSHIGGAGEHQTPPHRHISKLVLFVFFVFLLLSLEMHILRRKVCQQINRWLPFHCRCMMKHHKSELRSKRIIIHRFHATFYEHQNDKFVVFCCTRCSTWETVWLLRWTSEDKDKDTLRGIEFRLLSQPPQLPTHGHGHNTYKTTKEFCAI